MRQHSQQNLRHVPWDFGKRYVSMITLSLSTRRPLFLLWAAWLSVPGAGKATGMLSAIRGHQPVHSRSIGTPSNKANWSVHSERQAQTSSVTRIRCFRDPSHSETSNSISNPEGGQVR